MGNQKEILETIEFIRKATKDLNLDPEDVFLNGNCGNFYSFLKIQHKEAKPYRIYYKGEPYHIVSRIGNSFYDVTGETSMQLYIQRIIEKNKYGRFITSDFNTQEVTEEDVRKQSSKYRYDENFGESLVDSQMGKIEDQLQRRKREIEQEER